MLIRRFALFALKQFTLATLALIILLVGCQSRIIYHPRPYSSVELKMVEREGGQRLEFTTARGRQVAFYFPGTKMDRLWLVCGGNGSLALDYSYHRKAWGTDAGYLFVDYPGYGSCEGKPSPQAIAETFRALLPVIAARFKLPPEELRTRTSVLGHSIGAAAALIAAEEWGLKRAVLLTPFTTLTAMARKVVGSPLCYLNHHRFDNFARLETLRQRGGTATLFHGTHDEVIPTAMSRELTARYPDICHLHIIQNAMHNDILDLAQQEIVKAMRDQPLSQ